MCPAAVAIHRLRMGPATLGKGAQPKPEEKKVGPVEGAEDAALEVDRVAT
jgi:hypothetical protein